MSSPVYPIPIVEKQDIDLRLGIKSSLPNVKCLIGCVISMYYAAKKESIIKFCEEQTSNSLVSIKIEPSLIIALDELFKDELRLVQETTIESYFNGSPLLKSQMESLQVALELFLRIGKIDFENSTFPNTKERTGGSRYGKIFKPSSNLNLLRSCLEDDGGNLSKEAVKLLFFWVSKKDIRQASSSFFEKFIFNLTLLSEDTIFKIRTTNNDEITFKQIGIYEQLINGNTVINKDAREDVGPFRILKTYIKENLHPFIVNTTDGFTLRVGTDIKSLIHYKNQLENYFEITPKKTTIYQNEDETIDLKASDSTLKLNLILYGAPGTGKSFQLNKQAVDNFSKENISRVTFYPNYAYYNFVGSYRPKPIYSNIVDNRKFYDTDKSSVLTHQLEPIIDYTFVPGPFLTQLITALNNPEKKYLLIIEEINRANAATVFGDVFQLLDRNRAGKSEYTVKFNAEIIDYLKQNLNKKTNAAFFENEEVHLPNNLYLWATMNSADQGVQPMDAAFKRRWSFQYLPLNENEGERATNKIKLNFLKNSDKTIGWNDFRKQLNEHLKEVMKIQEDRLIGPFFLKEEELLDETAIKNKLLLYLREDIARHNPKNLFKKSTFSDIIRDYDEGKEIFTFSFETDNEVGEINS